MAQYSLEIDGKDYTGETASAKEQFEALHLVLGSKLVMGIKDDMSDQGLVLTLMSMQWSDLLQLEKLLVKGKVIRDADDAPVAQNLFRDDIANYALLIGLAARENLRGFYSLSGGKNADAGEQTAAAQ